MEQKSALIPVKLSIYMVDTYLTHIYAFTKKIHTMGTLDNSYNVPHSILPKMQHQTNTFEVDNTPKTGFTYNITKPIEYTFDTYVQYYVSTPVNPNTNIQITDPRGFTFNLTHRNLQLLIEFNPTILDTFNTTEFRYVTFRNTIYLLPTAHPLYKDAAINTDYRNQTQHQVSPEVKGSFLQTKNGKIRLYIGEFDIYTSAHTTERRHIFIDDIHIKGRKIQVKSKHALKSVKNKFKYIRIIEKTPELIAFQKHCLYQIERMSFISPFKKPEPHEMTLLSKNIIINCLCDNKTKSIYDVAKTPLLQQFDYNNEHHYQERLQSSIITCDRNGIIYDTVLQLPTHNIPSLNDIMRMNTANDLESSYIKTYIDNIDNIMINITPIQTNQNVNATKPVTLTLSDAINHLFIAQIKRKNYTVVYDMTMPHFEQYLTLTPNNY